MIIIVIIVMVVIIIIITKKNDQNNVYRNYNRVENNIDSNMVVKASIFLDKKALKITEMMKYR